MTRNIIILVILLIFKMSCKENGKVMEIADNPLIKEFKTPYGVPPFDKIEVEHYLPAFEKAMEEQNAEIEAIISNPESPTFSNTIEMLDYSGSLLTRVQNVYDNQLSTNTNEALQKAARIISPMLSRHRDNIFLNEALFNRVKEIYKNRDNCNLTVEQKKLLEKHHNNFVRNGANLDPAGKDRMRTINEELSLLTLQFGDNLLGEDNEWKLIVNNEGDLSGLPDLVKAGMADAAREAGYDGKWIVTLHKPSWIPFLQYSDKRELREKVYKAWMNRGNNENEFNNKDILKKIVSLRTEKAHLLGFETWADYVLDDRMAKTPDAVNKLLFDLWEKALPVAKREAAAMQAMIDEEGDGFTLASWDWWYYAEKIRKERYDIDDEQIRPYFELNNVRDGLFYVVNRLWGLQLEPIPDLPKPHPDAFAYEVKNADGSFIGILYMDFHPRASKRGGAWMNSYRKQSRNLNGEFIHPVITTVFNFSKPAGDQPALLTFDEVSTMFHEMGHALHGLLSDCTYESLSGTAVARDFVELPSQIMENWSSEPEVLKVYAKHFQTGEVIPDELINKMESASKFNQGFAMTEILAASLLDMQWHSLTEPFTGDVEKFEEEKMNEIGIIEEIIPRYKSTYFAHIFSGGYSAGYYSYTWAEVLDADAFMAFKETGDIFNEEKANAFRAFILSKGGTDDPMKLYNQFRGKDPAIEALLEKRGLI